MEGPRPADDTAPAHDLARYGHPAHDLARYGHPAPATEHEAVTGGAATGRASAGVAASANSTASAEVAASATAASAADGASATGTATGAAAASTAAASTVAAATGSGAPAASDAATGPGPATGSGAATAPDAPAGAAPEPGGPARCAPHRGAHTPGTGPGAATEGASGGDALAGTAAGPAPATSSAPATGAAAADPAPASGTQSAPASGTQGAPASDTQGAPAAGTGTGPASALGDEDAPAARTAPTPGGDAAPGPAARTAPAPGDEDAPDPAARTAPTPGGDAAPGSPPGPAALGRGVLLWAVLALPAVTADRLGMNEPRPLWQQLAGLAVLAAAAALSRRQPLASFALTAALGLAATPALFSVSYGPALGVFAVLLGLRAPRSRPAVTAFVAVALVGTARIALVGVDPPPEWLVLTGTLLFGCVFPWLCGRYWRQSRALAEAGWLKAARLEDEQRHAEERARLRERARIAQDMHDSLGHELSLLALRAAALQVSPGLATDHRAAAADLRAAAADATDHLHRIIGVLREDDEPVPLAPAGESVRQLVARAAESGLPVRWEEPSDTAAAEVPEPGGVTAHLLHRVVREALTNAARHAPGAPVVVAVRNHAHGTTVTVTNGPATQEATATRGGSGLLGLRAAVTSVGGDFRAGPHAEGFRVRAYVPAQRSTTSARQPAGSPAGTLTAVTAPFTRARRRVALGLGAAAGAGAVLVGAAFGWYAYTETHSVLTPAAYAKLRPGTPYDEVAPVLPDREAHDPPTDRAPAPPAGAHCRYYRASGELLVSIDHFRLCFDTPGRQGRLISKDVVPGVGRPDPDREESTENGGPTR
ncbi:histidine kinase [Streptomyces rochei]|uniref:histidine kinase n=1 Tax=Streptomyces rochei TaxID=1928 RepID=UPI0037FA0284